MVELMKAKEIVDRLWKIHKLAGADGVTIVCRDGRWHVYAGSAISAEGRRFGEYIATGSESLHDALNAPLRNIHAMTEEAWKALDTLADVLDEDMIEQQAMSTDMLDTPSENFAE